MVPEPTKSTGVTLPYENKAMNGDDMPDNLDYPDQIMFLQLRMLYDQFKKGIISRDTAQKEKRQLLKEYECYKFRNGMEMEWVEIIKLTELARAEFRKNPSIETAERLVNIIEGRGKGCHV